jgi:type I restriction enzyme S subunit
MADRLAREIATGLPQFQPHDTLVAKITPCFENGKGALVAALPHRYGFGSTEFHIIRPNGIANPEFLYWLTRSANFRRLGEQNMTGSAGQRRVPTEFIGAFSVLLPPVAEQEKIAEILSGIDTMMVETRRVIEQARSVKRALMQELLTNGMPGRHTDFKDSPLGRVPADWRIANLGDVAKIGNGSTPSKNVSAYWNGGDIPWLPTSKVNDRIITAADTFITRKALDECPLSLIPSGAILVAMIGQGKTRGMCAYLAIPATINQNFASIVPGTALDEWFLFHLLSDQYAKLRRSGRGSNQDALNCAILKSYLVPVPGIDEQREISKLAGAIDCREEVERRQLQALAALKEAVLSRLLAGDIRAPTATEPKSLEPV